MGTQLPKLTVSSPPAKTSRVSFAPSTFESPMDRVLASCKTYLLGDSADVDDAFASQKSDCVFIKVQKRKYILREIEDGSEKDEGKATGLYSLKDLVSSEIPKPHHIVADLLFEGEVMLLGGRPKVGKSRLVHQMILNLSAATPFLGMAVPTPRRVLLIDLENKPWSIKDRLLRMAPQASASIDTAFIWCADSLAGNTLNSKPEGIKKLQSLLDQTGAEVLFIDPWRLWLGGDENNSEETVKGLAALSQLRKDRPTLTVVIVHHVRKERFESPTRLMRDPSLWVENISGHHALVSHVDACYGLDRQEHGEEEVLVFGGVARNVDPRTLLLNDDPESLRFEVAATEEAALATMTPKEKEIWGRIRMIKDRFTWTEAFGAAKTTNRKSVSSVLKKAEGHGLIKKNDTGYRVVKLSKPELAEPH
ncbi:MAG TPA: AAA family ATPase [Candidatus Sulfotelmatobacter sp.]